MRRAASRSRRRPAGPARVDVNLDPMIDVTFLLVIFFLCTLNMRVLEGRLESRLPKDRGQLPALVERLVDPLDLRVERDPTRVGGAVVRVGPAGRSDLASLAPLLAAAKRATPDREVRLAAGEGVTHGMVMAVLDACLAVGLTQVRFAW